MKNSVVNTVLSLVFSIIIWSCEPIEPDPEATINSISPPSGYAGSELNIIGNELSGVTTVSIGGYDATILENDATSIKVTVPDQLSPGVYTVNVSVNGSNYSSSEQFQVTDPADEAVNGLALVVTSNPQIPYMVNNGEGEVISIFHENTDGSRWVAYKNSETENALLLGSDGNPILGVFGEHIIYFQFEEEGLLTIGVIDNLGNFYIERGLITNNLFTEQTEIVDGGRLAVNNYAYALRSASYGLNIMGCAISAGLSATGASPAITDAAISCSSAIVSTINRLNESEYEQLTGTSTAFGIFANSIGCATIITPTNVDGLSSRISLVADLMAEVQDQAEQKLVDNQEDIDLLHYALIYGGVDVKITLTWDNTADLDLHVTDPDNETIYFQNPFSNSGGALDVDDVDGFGPENIYWQQNGAPEGIYTVYVAHLSGEVPVNWHVLIQANGFSRRYSGTLGENEYAMVTSFVLGEPLLNSRIVNPPLSLLDSIK
jgi:hypothetical protein